MGKTDANTKKIIQPQYKVQGHDERKIKLHSFKLNYNQAPSHYSKILIVIVVCQRKTTCATAFNFTMIYLFEF